MMLCEAQYPRDKFSPLLQLKLDLRPDLQIPRVNVLHCESLTAAAHMNKKLNILPLLENYPGFWGIV